MTDEELDAAEERAKVWAPDTSVASDLARDVLALAAEARRLHAHLHESVRCNAFVEPGAGGCPHCGEFIPL